MKMKSAILVFLYAARSQAEHILPGCVGNAIFSNCDKAGQEVTSASLSVASETSTGYHKSEPTTRPNGNTNYFISPDGSTILDINSSVDVLWVTDETDSSVQLNCTLDATKENFTSKGVKPQAISFPPNIYTLEGLQFPLPNKSAMCTLGMLDAKGNPLAKNAKFTVRDDVHAVTSSTARGDLATTLPTSDTATSTSSIFTNTANSNATLTASLTASSANSTSTPALSALSASVPSTTASSIMSSTIPTATAAKASKAGSDPNARLQTVIGILAGAAALLLVQWPS